MIFYNLKKDISNEGSNFVLSQLEVAQTQPCFDKLHEIASYNNFRIRQDSEFAKFCDLSGGVLSTGASF